MLPPATLFVASDGDQVSDYHKNFCQVRRQQKTLKGATEVWRGQVQKSPKALGIGSSDFRHTQYAFPKKGNAVLESFTFQVNFIKM